MRLRPVALVVTFALGLLAGPLPAEAQQPGKVYRVGLLVFGRGGPTTSSTYMGLRQGLCELGYIEGQNLIIEYRSAEGKPERRPEKAAELVRLKVDVIVTPGVTPLIRAAKQATSTIPIVMSGASADPIKAGFVVSLARPGGNITGMTNLTSKLHPKRLELLKEAFPEISRVAILWPPNQQKHAMKEVEAVRQALGIQIQSLVVETRSGLAGLESAFSTISQERPDALLLGSFGLTLRHRARVVDFMAKRRLPTIYDSNIFVDAGGLMSYGAISVDSYRRAATYVDKILKGANPADLPVEQATTYELVINLKTAKKIGLRFPPQFLARANRVIK